MKPAYEVNHSFTNFYLKQKSI